MRPTGSALVIGAPVALYSGVQKLAQIIACGGHIQLDANPNAQGVFEDTSNFGS